MNVTESNKKKCDMCGFVLSQFYLGVFQMKSCELVIRHNGEDYVETCEVCNQFEVEVSKVYPIV